MKDSTKELIKGLVGAYGQGYAIGITALVGTALTLLSESKLQKCIWAGSTALALFGQCELLQNHIETTTEKFYDKRIEEDVHEMLSK